MAGRGTPPVAAQIGERHALALHLADKLVALAAMDEQFARPARFVIEAVAALVFGDMGVEQPKLAVALAGMGVGQLAAAVVC